MVEDPNIDALWICSPNNRRIENMEESVDAILTGKGTLKGVCCEKPLGRNVAEAKKLLELVKKADLNHGYLEDPFEATPHQQVREEKIDGNLCLLTVGKKGREQTVILLREETGWGIDVIESERFWQPLVSVPTTARPSP